MIKRAKEGDRLEGIGAARDINSFVNLQHADDTLLFGKTDIRL